MNSKACETQNQIEILQIVCIIDYSHWSMGFYLFFQNSRIEIVTDTASTL